MSFKKSLLKKKVVPISKPKPKSGVQKLPNSKPKPKTGFQKLRYV
jgi:hypothetical protein